MTDLLKGNAGRWALLQNRMGHKFRNPQHDFEVAPTYFFPRGRNPKQQPRMKSSSVFPSLTHRVTKERHVHGDLSDYDRLEATPKIHDR